MVKVKFKKVVNDNRFQVFAIIQDDSGYLLNGYGDAQYNLFIKDLYCELNDVDKETVNDDLFYSMVINRLKHFSISGNDIAVSDIETFLFDTLQYFSEYQKEIEKQSFNVEYNIKKDSTVKYIVE